MLQLYPPSSKYVPLLLILLSSHVCSVEANASLPVVDLGYELYEATSFNPTADLYNFSNIRYAAPPRGENRFRAPAEPTVNRSQIQRASRPDRICPQANGEFLALLSEWIEPYLAGQNVFNESLLESGISTSAPPVQDPRTTEDCLFLDITVPKQIFDSRGNKQSGAAVLVWIHGGSFSSGSKSSSGNATGLVLRGQRNDDGGVIFVSINYRLGAFGWLSGPTFQQDGIANAGLHDRFSHWNGSNRTLRSLEEILAV